MNCDDCKHYHWYYDYCDKWDCEMDARACNSCFEARETVKLMRYDASEQQHDKNSRS